MGQSAGRSKAETARALSAYSCAVLNAPAVHLLYMACMCKLIQSTKVILPVISALSAFSYGADARAYLLFVCGLMYKSYM